MRLGSQAQLASFGTLNFTNLPTHVLLIITYFFGFSFVQVLNNRN
jgi:hypothetical protein